MGTETPIDDEPPTNVVHDNSWSANLEGPDHGADSALVIQGAIDAIERTAPGYHVNLVTHENHGHPETYVYEPLRERFGSMISIEYVAQCGCGGYTSRVRVRDASASASD